MKKKFIFALGVVMLVTLSFMCLNINATSTMIGQYDISATADDSVTATLYENNGEYSVVISGNGNMKNFDDNSERPWDEYGSYNKKLTKATIENGVTSIGNKAFYSMYYLQEVEVANTVTIIGEEAFYSSGIKEFLMTDNIVSIGEKAFYMSDLENLRLSSNLKEISRSAFEWCSELANIEIPEGIEKIDAYAFAFCEGNQKLYIPESVKQIGTGVFSSWDKLESVEISNGVTEIGKLAFSHCDKLTKITIPNNVQTIDSNNSMSSIVDNCDNVTAYCKTGSAAEKHFEEFSINYLIDENLPEITNVNISEIDWTNQDVTITIEAKDELSGLSRYAYSFDGGITWQEENYKTYSENIDGIVIKVKDCLYNTAEYEEIINITNIDKIYPEIENVTGNAEKWTNQDVTIIISSTDNLSGFGEDAYSFDGGATWQKENYKTYSENIDGIEIQIKDKAGNITIYEQIINITKIDKEKPIIENVIGNPTAWTNENVTLTIEGTDNLSGVTEYSFDGGITWQEESSKTYEENTAGIVVKIKDAAGNESELSSEINITKIDKEKPIIENVIGNPTVWTNENVTLTIEGNDNLSGVTEYSFDGGVTWQETSSKTYEENTAGIVVKIKDAAGNESELSSEINITKIDKEKPIIENVIGNAIVWTNENVTLTIEGMDNLSGVTEYSFDGGVTWQEASSKTYEENTSGIVVKIKDAAGNEGELSQGISITKIDKEKPIIENVIGNPTVWTNENVTLTIEGNDNLSGITEYSFDGGETWQEASSKTYEENTSEIVVKIKDAAGNEGELIQGISITKIDKEKPVIENVIGNPTAWTNQNVTLVIEGRDNLSGVTGYSFDGGITWQEESSKTYEENTSGIVVKIKDAVGNESEPLEEISITKIRKPETLEITKVPMKMQYEAYEDFDSTEMIITIIYNNGDREVTTDYTIVNEKRLTCLVTKLEIQFNENPEIKVLLEGIEVGHAEVELLPKAAKCTETGLTQGKYCEVCNEVLVEQEVIPALGHNYENGECTQCGEQVNIEVMSEVYKLENLYISKLSLQTTIDQFKANIQSNATEINVYSKEGKLLTANEIIGTGMQLKVTLGGKTETYSLVVTGDINGNGLIDIQDMVKINAHRLNKKPLQGANLLAADVDENQTINMSDLLKINRYRLHKITNL